MSVEVGLSLFCRALQLDSQAALGWRGSVGCARLVARSFSPGSTPKPTVFAFAVLGDGGASRRTADPRPEDSARGLVNLHERISPDVLDGDTLARDAFSDELLNSPFDVLGLGRHLVISGGGTCEVSTTYFFAIGFPRQLLV